MSDSPGTVPEIFIGAAGNLVGGLLATAVWAGFILLLDKRRERRLRTEKRQALALEIAKLRAVLKTLVADPAAASGSGPIEFGVLSALLRLGPSLTSNSSFEPILAEAEFRLHNVNVVCARMAAHMSGVALALKNADEIAATTANAVSVSAKTADGALQSLETWVLGAH